MIGGIVYKFEQHKGYDRIHVRGTDHDRHHKVAIRVKPCGLPIQSGDTVWWQSRTALWTNAAHTARDIHMERIGYTEDGAHA